MCRSIETSIYVGPSIQLSVHNHISINVNLYRLLGGPKYGLGEISEAESYTLYDIDYELTIS